MFDTTKNKLDYYRVKNCMKNCCKDLKEHATKIFNYGKKDMIPLPKEEKMHNKQKVCHTFKKGFSAADNNVAPNKNYFKVKDHCHYTEVLLMISAI